MEDRYWESFTKTGSVTDYLYYRGMDMLKSCNDKIDKIEKKMLVLDE